MNAKENGLVEFVHKNIEQYNKKVMQQEYEKQLKFTNVPFISETKRI